MQVRNHAIPGTVINGIIDKLFEFFDLPEDYKHKYYTKDPTDLIRWGKGNINHVSREFVKMAVHPTFHCPSNPPGFRSNQRKFLIIKLYRLLVN